MAKGRVAWVFWLLAVLAVLTSTASYAWLSLNLSAGAKGIAVNLESDSRFLQISANKSDGYSNEISFGKDIYLMGGAPVDEIYLTTYGYLPSEGGLLITPTEITVENSESLGFSDGVYAGVGKLFASSNSDISADSSNFEDVSADLTEGDSVIGLYLIEDLGEFHPTSENADNLYYFRHVRHGITDYVCVGSFDVGETLSGRRYWGYAVSENENDAESHRMISVVSMDLPTKDYAMRKTVFIRTAKGSLDVSGLGVSSVEIKGLRNYLTDAIRIMFVAKNDSGSEVTFFYDNSEPEAFNGVMFDKILGDRAETITVDMYIFFDGKNEKAFSQNSVLSNHSIEVNFSIDEN